MARWLFDLEARATGQPVLAFTHTVEADTCDEAVQAGMRALHSPEWHDAAITTFTLSCDRLTEGQRP